MVAFVCHPTTWEAETGGSQRIQGQQHELCNETLILKINANLLSDDIIKIAGVMNTFEVKP